MSVERPIVFKSEGHDLLGILHLPDGDCDVGLIMMPAAAQYRVGPHRQHVLIARALAARGIATLRYDCSGTADSGGPYRDFEAGPDIDGSIEAMLSIGGLKHVVLWGICGSASALLMHERLPAVVCGLILVNPWVRSERSQSRTYLKFYYLHRLTNADFWRKIASGRFDFHSSLASLASTARSALRPERRRDTNEPGAATGQQAEPGGLAMEERMARGLVSFRGRILLIMSENDLTAREFDEFTYSSKRWRRLMKSRSIDRRDLLRSDHVFSQPEWRAQVIDWMSEWLLALPYEIGSPVNPANAPTSASPRTSAESRHG